MTEAVGDKSRDKEAAVGQRVLQAIPAITSPLLSTQITHAARARRWHWNSVERSSPLQNMRTLLFDIFHKCPLNSKALVQGRGRQLYRVLVCKTEQKAIERPDCLSEAMCPCGFEIHFSDYGERTKTERDLFGIIPSAGNLLWIKKSRELVFFLGWSYNLKVFFVFFVESLSLYSSQRLEFPLWGIMILPAWNNPHTVPTTLHTSPLECSRVISTWCGTLNQAHTENSLFSTHDIITSMYAQAGSALQ